MIELYMAVNSETNETLVFTGYEDLREFAMSNKYAYNYYNLGDVEELIDSELGYWRG